MKNDALRKQVINHMADVAKAAMEQGLEGMPAIEHAFPGTPLDVVVQAWLQADGDMTEEWWAQIERTIDADAGPAPCARATALDALRLAKAECTDMSAPPMVLNLVTAALAYFEASA